MVASKNSSWFAFFGIAHFAEFALMTNERNRFGVKFNQQRFGIYNLENKETYLADEFLNWS